MIKSNSARNTMYRYPDQTGRERFPPSSHSPARHGADLPTAEPYIAVAREFYYDCFVGASTRVQIMPRAVVVLTAVLGAVFAASMASVFPSAAADLPLAGRGAPQLACGPCGCLRVTFDYHRELQSTYGTGFDPRNYDETQPHYYFGGMRAFPRYSQEDCSNPYWGQ
jgi:hypothetical protein